MKETKMTFQRLEKKYLIHETQKERFLKHAMPYLTMDAFGPSTICNIYYDTDHYDLITNSIQKPPYKEKLRLRCYGICDKHSTVYLEIKKKCKGVVNKRRAALTILEAQNYLERGIHTSKQSQILSEIDYFISYYHPQPKVFLAYDREPFIGNHDSDIRITFDSNLRRRYDQLSLLDGDVGHALLAEGMIIMEIKVKDAYPLWLTQILSQYEIYPCSFSKYGTAFLKDIVEKERGKLCSQVF